jgi:hypothetical protein
LFFHRIQMFQQRIDHLFKFIIQLKELNYDDNKIHHLKKKFFCKIFLFILCDKKPYSSFITVTSLSDFNGNTISTCIWRYLDRNYLDSLTKWMLLDLQNISWFDWTMNIKRLSYVITILWNQSASIWLLQMLNR